MGLIKPPKRPTPLACGPDHPVKGAPSHPVSTLNPQAVRAGIPSRPSKPPAITVPTKPSPYLPSSPTAKSNYTTATVAPAVQSRAERLKSACRGVCSNQIVDVQVDREGLCMLLTGVTPSRIRNLAEAAKVSAVQRMATSSRRGKLPYVMQQSRE